VHVEGIEDQGWSLNPGRYVGVAPGEELDEEDFRTILRTLSDEFISLSSQARDLESRINNNVEELLRA
jgi:type I restriction enzyme M protein